jgi:hypothetical protein
LRFGLTCGFDAQAFCTRGEVPDVPDGDQRVVAPLRWDAAGVEPSLEVSERVARGRGRRAEAELVGRQQRQIVGMKW